MLRIPVAKADTLNYIIYDLEATCWRGRPPSDVQEIIEIGAVMVNSYGEVEGAFNQFVRPVVNPRLSMFCQELTSIEQEDVDRAKTFIEVCEEFQDWGLMFDEDYVLCSWGAFDKRMLISDCELHGMEHDWVNPHINLKKQYREIKRLKNARGLRRTVESEGFEFTGIPHRAISDAENLAKVFTKHLDMWQV